MRPITYLVVTIAITIVLIISGCSQTPTGEVITQQEQVIKLGFIGPLTGDGASFGLTEKNAVEMALNEINSKGDINEKRLEVIYEDGKCSGKEAAIAAQKLVNTDKVKVILGGICSAETLATAPITEAKKVILFSAFSGNPQITDAGEYIFRNVPKDSDWVGDAAKFVFKKHRRAAILTENSDYPQGVRELFKQYFTQFGGEIVVDEVFEMNSKDYRTQITKIKYSDADVIFLNPQSGVSGGLAARQIRELEVNLPIYSSFVWSSSDALEAAGDASEGVIFFDIPKLDPDNKKASAFIEKYTTTYGDPASDYEAGARYDSVYIIADALKICAEDTDCIKDYLYSIKDYYGTIGHYHFDSKGDFVGAKLTPNQIRNGKVVAYEWFFCLYFLFLSVLKCKSYIIWEKYLKE